MNTRQPTTTEPHPQPLQIRPTLWRWLRRTLLACLVLILIAAATIYMALPQRGVFLTDSWQLHEAHDGPAIGNLGGVPVQIPSEFARFLEYDGDPGLFAKRQGPVPVRTAQSVIRSFGFEVLFPQMVGVTSETAALRKQTPMEISMWLNVGLRAGHDYKGEQFLDLMADDLNAPKAQRVPLQRTPGGVFGMTAYAPKGSATDNFRLNTRYVHRDGNGHVDTYIECYPDPLIYTPCTLYTDLRPAMRASLEVHFRKDMLPSWQAIQQSVTRVVLSFKKPTS
jgi:hypothetical protein